LTGQGEWLGACSKTTDHLPATRTDRPHSLTHRLNKRLDSVRFLLASTQEQAKKIFKDLILESAQYNMQINAKKTKTMVVTRNEGIQAKLEH